MTGVSPRASPGSTLGLVVLLLVVGVVVWGVLLFGLGRSTEDLCLDDMDRTGYQSSSMRGEILPPRLDCELRNPLDASKPVETTVGHPLRAAAWAFAVGGLPAAWLVGTGVLVRRRLR